MTDQEFDKINSLQPLSEILPIIFLNGSQVNGIATRCSVCKKDISPENTNTDMVTFEHCIALEAYSICYDCHMITPTRMRISDDGNMLVAKGDGTWLKTSYVTRPSAWSSFRTLLLKWRQLWAS